MAAMVAAQERRDGAAEQPQLDLETEAQTDPVAAQKVIDIKNEKAPRAAETTRHPRPSAICSK